MKLRPQATGLVCEGKIGAVIGKRGYTVGRSYPLMSQKDNDLGVRAVAANVIDLDLADLTDHQAQLAGFANRGEAFQWYREKHEKTPAPATRQEPPKGTYKVVLTLFGLDNTHRYKLLGKTPGHDYTETPALALHGGMDHDPGEAVDDATQLAISEGKLSSDGQRTYDLLAAQERAARLARPPELQLREELEALRAESPGDVWRYEAQAVALAEKIRAKRRRRAA